MNQIDFSLAMKIFSKTYSLYPFDDNKNFNSPQDLSEELTNFIKELNLSLSSIWGDEYYEIKFPIVFAEDIKLFVNHIDVDYSAESVKDTPFDSLVQGNHYRFRAGSSIFFYGEVLGILRSWDDFLLMRVLPREDVYLAWRVKDETLYRLEIC